MDSLITLKQVRDDESLNWRVVAGYVLLLTVGIATLLAPGFFLEKGIAGELSAVQAVLFASLGVVVGLLLSSFIWVSTRDALREHVRGKWLAEVEKLDDTQLEEAITSEQLIGFEKRLIARIIKRRRAGLDGQRR